MKDDRHERDNVVIVSVCVGRSVSIRLNAEGEREAHIKNPPMIPQLPQLLPQNPPPLSCLSLPSQIKRLDLRELVLQLFDVRDLGWRGGHAGEEFGEGGRVGGGEEHGGARG